MPCGRPTPSCGGQDFDMFPAEEAAWEAGQAVGQISLAYFLHGDRDSGFKNMFKGLAHLDVSDDSI